MTESLQRPTFAYLVSAYPAISHTFILREVLRLRALGHRIVTASINRADRPAQAMEEPERREAEQTYVVKEHGVKGALAALTWWAVVAPGRLLATLAMGWRLRTGGRAWWTGLAYAVEAAMVARWMQREAAQHLHVHFGSAGATVGVLVRRLNGCHLSLTVHGPDEFDDVVGQHLALKMREADAVICISQFARSQLMRISDPVHWDKLRVCRLGVEPGQFQFKLRDAGAVTRLLCVGRLTPAKGQVLLVRAMARLRERGVTAQLTLVGDGPDRARVEAEISARALADRVTLTGALRQQQVREQLDTADIFVLPSLAEGIPVVLMEAMSCGVPSVTTPVNGIPELVVDGQTGLLATPGDVDSLADRLQSLIESPERRRDIALRAHDRVREGFDLARNVAALGALFDAFPRRASARQNLTQPSREALS